MIKLKLETFLAENDISKNEFARRLNVPHAHVRRYFRDGYDPKFSMVSRWVKALDCSILDLVKEKDEKSKKSRKAKVK